jgi:monofunctional glycosyltransferase
MKKLFKKAGKVLLWMAALHLAYTLIILFVNPPVTLTMVSSVVSGYGLKRDYVSSGSISPNAKLAVIAAEDQLFAEHYGFDVKSIQQAIEFNENSKGKKIRGGSTISQQVAKNVFLWQGRSYFRKGLEAYCTVLIELLYSKRRIIELYLNVAEMGEGIFGIEAAAQHYFKKPASKLTRREAASIAACLPAPRKYRVNPPSRYVSRRVGWIQRQMNQLEGDPAIQKIILNP